MAGKFQHGAFIQFTTAFMLPVPNVIVFQFNPETINHTWKQSEKYSASATSNPLAVKGTPGESFSFNLQLNSDEMIARGSPVAQGIAMTSGIYTRLAALEMLLYPAPTSLGALLGQAAAELDVNLSTGSITGKLDDKITVVTPLMQLPVVLWVWGPARILPVRVTSLTITEKLYDPLMLNPVYAEAQIGLDVLTREELRFVQGPLASTAQFAYKFSQAFRESMALANLANTDESIVGMLPI